MAITPENLAWHEFIGLRVRVAASSSTLSHRGISGMVVDETKNTIVLRGKSGTEKVVPKKGSIFRFALPGGKKAELDGNKIAFRPYDRPKKVQRTSSAVSSAERKM